jgi:hypothetical protein
VRLENVSALPALLSALSEDACKMSQKVYAVYHRYMANATQIMSGIEASIDAHTRIVNAWG